MYWLLWLTPSVSLTQFDHLNRDIKATELRAKTIANLVDSVSILEKFISP